MKNFSRSVSGKLTMFILCIISGCAFLLFLCAAVFMNMSGMTYREKDDVFDEYAKRVIAEKLEKAIYYGNYEIDFNGLITIDTKSLNMVVRATDTKGNVYAVSSELSEDKYAAEPFESAEHRYKLYLVQDSWGDYYYVTEDLPSGSNFMYVDVRLRNGLPVLDALWLLQTLINIIYGMSYGIIARMAISFLLTFILFVLILSVSGHIPDTDEVQSNFADKMPFEFILFSDFVITASLLSAIISIGNEIEGITSSILLLSLFVVVFASLGLLTLMNIAVRIKLKKFWRTTLVGMCFVLAWDMLARTVRVLAKIPFVLKTFLIFCGISFFEFIVLCSSNTGIHLLGWMIEKIILFPLIIYCATCFKRLVIGTEKIASGETDYNIKTGSMSFEFKEMGNNLNNISDGVARAVEESIKSEKMKAELITNVSHDIKTPLTSIINYAMLIGKEETDNEKIKEYSDILVKKSTQLKRLLEDLVEVSRSSTGNIEIVLSECDTSMFLEQSIGEYKDKLENADLTLVTNAPPEKIFINADPRRMWRIFDNLMSNICKYSMPGTRVYMDLIKETGADGKDYAVFTMRNTSKRQLNIPPDELMGRFVRGDTRRNTEGSGLGLSIAQNLAELQGGTLEVKIDADLFKAILKFPVLEKNEIEDSVVF